MKTKLTVPKKITLTLTPEQQEMLSCILAIPECYDATATSWASDALTTGLIDIDRHPSKHFTTSQLWWLRARGYRAKVQGVKGNTSVLAFFNSIMAKVAMPDRANKSA